MLVYKTTNSLNSYGKSELREKPKSSLKLSNLKFSFLSVTVTFMSDRGSEHQYFPAQLAPGQTGSCSSHAVVSRLPSPG